MGSIILELDDKTKEVKIGVKDLNPIDVVNLCLGACQQAMEMIKPPEENKIIKPSLRDAVKINKEVN